MASRGFFKAIMFTVCLGFAVAIAACKPPGGSSEKSIYTLYRSSSVMDAARIHVATFDAGEDMKYNFENCQIATELFRGQPGVSVRYWCEQGRFKR